MSRKIVVALWAFALLIVTAWADTSVGGEGGCINLPGGRGGARPNSGGAQMSVAWEATTGVSPNGLLMRLPNELFGAVAIVRGATMPLVATYGSLDGYVRLPASIVSALRMGDVGFTVDFFNMAGTRLQVRADYVGEQLRLRVE